MEQNGVVLSDGKLQDLRHQGQIQCFVCKQEVKFEGYKGHLNTIHNIKDTSFFIENALHRMENRTETAPELMEIDGEDDDGKETFKNQVMNKVETSLTKLFAPIVQLCKEEGNVADNGDIEDENNSVMDEVLDNIFKELKEALSGQKLVEKCFKPSNIGQVKAGSTVISEKSKEVKDTDAIKPILEPPKNFPKKVAKSLSKAQIGPDPLDRECPKTTCTFRTSKQGMRNLEAANHLVSIHKVTVADIKEHPSKFAFKKVQPQ